MLMEDNINIAKSTSMEQVTQNSERRLLGRNYFSEKSPIAPYYGK